MHDIYMSMPLHFHTIVTYDGSVATESHPSFTAAVDHARREVMTERLLDAVLPRSKRRKFERREFIPGVYGDWVGRSIHTEPIRIEVSACTPAMHEH